MVLLLTANAVSAQSLDSIINKHIEAMGGEEKLASVQSVLMKGTMKFPDFSVKFKLTCVENKLYKLELKLVLGKSMYSMTTDTASWEYFPNEEPALRRLPDTYTAANQLKLDIMPLFNYAQKGYKLTLLGEDTSHEWKDSAKIDEAYRIKVEKPSGGVAMIWINAKTDLIDNYTQFSTDSTGLVYSSSASLYTDYRPVNGVMFPYGIVTEKNGKIDALMDVKEIDLNQPVDPKVYRLD